MIKCALLCGAHFFDIHKEQKNTPQAVRGELRGIWLFLHHDLGVRGVFLDGLDAV